jgi:hypothetical protein
MIRPKRVKAAMEKLGPSRFLKNSLISQGKTNNAARRTSPPQLVPCQSQNFTKEHRTTKHTVKKLVPSQR